MMDEFSLQLLKDFQKESKNVIESLVSILDTCENGFKEVKKLEDYGQQVDRIMGGARSLALVQGDPHQNLMPLGDYTSILKALGYRSSQITTDEKLYQLCVAVLQDATDCLLELVEQLTDPKLKVKDVVPQTLIDRVRWVYAQFPEMSNTEGAKSGSQLKAEKMNQKEIDDLLKKLGM